MNDKTRTIEELATDIVYEEVMASIKEMDNDTVSILSPMGEFFDGSGRKYEIQINITRADI